MTEPRADYQAGVKAVEPENTGDIRKRRIPKNAWKPGYCPNPGGRPKNEATWRGIINEMMDMSPDDIARLVGKDNDLGRSLLMLPRNVQMKYLIVARLLSAIMFEPTHGLVNALMDRSEGKVADNVNINANVNGTWAAFVKGSNGAPDTE
jgi:hypothetical protein